MKTLTQERVHLTMSSDQLSAIDEWRRLQMDLPSRAEAVRRLVEWAVRQEKGDRLSPARLAHARERTLDQHRGQSADHGAPVEVGRSAQG